jgi:transposase-like protein
MKRTKKQSTEAAVREIRRRTRRKFAPEEKIRIVLEGLRGEQSIQSCAAAKGSPRTSTTAGARTFSKRARSSSPATRFAKQLATKSKISAPRTRNSRKSSLRLRSETESSKKV